MADQAGDGHGRRPREWRLNRVRLGQADALGVHGKAHILQQLGEGGAFVERSREIGAIARVDVGHGSSGISGPGAWESHVGAPSANTRRCPSVVPLPSSPNHTPTSPPRTFVPEPVSTMTT